MKMIYGYKTTLRLCIINFNSYIGRSIFIILSLNRCHIFRIMLYFTMTHLVNKCYKIKIYSAVAKLIVNKQKSS